MADGQAFAVILLAIDRSEHSKRALSVVGELAPKLGSEVVVVHALELEHDWPVGIDPIGSPMLVEELVATREQLTKQARELVAGAVEELAGKGVRVRGEVLAARTTTAKRLLDAASQVGADLVVIGSRGLTDLGGLLLGSVSHQLIHMAASPVLVVR